MSGKNRSRIPLLAALALTAVWALWVWRCTEPHFALGDDYYLARAFAGEVGGVKETYNLYIHTVFAWLLHSLTVAFPGVWWFSWLQMALLAGGGFALVLGLSRAAQGAGLPWWTGCLAGAVFWAAFAMEYTVAVTFTTTAAVAGAGAICLLGGTNLRASGATLYRPLLASAALVWCAGMLRGVSALPIAVFWLGLLMAKLLAAGMLPPKPLIKTLVLILAITGALIGVRLAENALTPAEDGYRDFLNATVEPIDYGGLNAVSPEALAKIGWTEKETALVRSWYFLDENMSAENFRHIGAAAQTVEKAPLWDRVTDGLQRVLDLCRKAPGVGGFLLICLGLCGAAFLAALLCRDKNLWRFLAPVGCAGVTLALLFYLGFQGRLPIRAAAAVLLPASAMALVLALEGIANCRTGWGRALPGAALLCCLLLALGLGRTAFLFCHRPDHGDPDACAFAAAERYAAAHGETLFIGDRTMGADARMFPERSSPAPVNLLPMWGGWNNHSQGYRAAFAAHGLDHDRFHITEFLGDSLRLITGPAGVSPEFLDYLEEQAGGSVTPVSEHGEEGFTVYRFQQATGKDDLS